MTAKENKKIADEALISKIENEIDKAAKEGYFNYIYNDMAPRNIVYHFLTLGYRVYITFASDSTTIFDWSTDENGIYIRPYMFADYRSADIEEVPLH